MSEALAGLPPAPPAAVPREAAIAVPIRRGAAGVEVLWVQRSRDLGFAGGFHAFPGGKVDAADAGADPFRAAAVRELREETGLTVEARALWPAGRWITPPSFAQRFDARLFLVEIPPDAPPPRADGQELVSAEWVRPQVAWDEWSAGRALLHAPVLHALSVLRSFTGPEDAAARMAQTTDAVDFVSQRLEYQRGVRAVPLLTETLPPAAHTNAYLLGEDELLLVDPGATDEAERARLAALLEQLAHQGRRVQAVVLTHRHHDHVGAAAWLQARHGLPVWTHALTAAEVEVPVARQLRDGEVLSLGGAFPMDWQVLHTPGHARGHVCLLEPRSRALIAGDMVSGFGTVLIDPPEGHMGEYLRQLARLEVLPVGTLYPAHGPPLPDGPRVLRELRAHREAREQKVLAAMEQGLATLPDIARAAYPELPPEAAPLTERSTRAILLKLVQEGRVSDADGYRRTR